MTIGIPSALMYYRYSVLWESFFRFLGFDVLCSGDTNRETLEQGERMGADECCVPSKLYMGHVCALLGRCDHVFTPRLAVENGGEFCPRMFGLFDAVRFTFPGCSLLTYDPEHRGEQAGFVRLGQTLGLSARRSLAAYRRAHMAQRQYDIKQQIFQEQMSKTRGTKILFAGPPYLLRDPYIGRPVARGVRDTGAVLLYSDCYDKKDCAIAAEAIVPGLRWNTQKEAAGAVALHGGDADGVIMLSAYPCGSDALAFELLLRSLPATPILRLIIDGLESETGLQTRLESFMDIVGKRSCV